MARRFRLWTPGHSIVGWRWLPAVLMILAVLLGGCFSEKGFIERMTPAEDNALARQFVEAVRTGQIDAAREMLVPKLNNDNSAKNLAEIRRRFLDHGDPQLIELVGYTGRKNFAGTESDSAIAYQIRFSNAWVLARVEVERRDGLGRIREANFTPLTDALEAQNAFTFRGKPPWQYLCLAACAGIPIFILGTAFVCARTRVRRKWLWIIFILFGICRFELNWASGAFDVSPAFFQLGGAGITRGSVFSPWILNWSIPLGAIIFLARRRQLDLSTGKLTEKQPPPLPAPPAHSSGEENPSGPSIY